MLPLYISTPVKLGRLNVIVSSKWPERVSTVVPRPICSPILFLDSPGPSSATRTVGPPAPTRFLVRFSVTSLHQPVDGGGHVLLSKTQKGGKDAGHRAGSC